MGLANIARQIEDTLNRRGTVRRRKQGWVPQIIPYAGYGSPHALKIMARALMAPQEHLRTRLRINALGLHKRIKNSAVRDFAELAIETGAEAERGWRQFFTTQVGYLPVTVTVGAKTIETRTDRNGYIDLLVEGHGLEPGWHEATITPIYGEAVQAPIMIVSPTAEEGIVSDIDDTILVTWLPRAALAAWNSFVKRTNTRQTVPGMADLYHKLIAGKEETPIFYLSTGAWNTYSTLLGFIREYRFPIGPLLMTDWGPTPTGLFRSGQEHKKTQLRNLLIIFPNIKWTLIGDDGQHDPLIYDELAREHPSRVKLIMLRELNPVEQILSHGSPEPTSTIRKESDIEKQGTPVIRGKDGNSLLEKLQKLQKLD
ncbi:MAG: phosphatase domain-containing protein [Arcanobacterium sp.]|nr:phosphatase domain-containing protein [Arcanobacterium sp.]